MKTLSWWGSRGYLFRPTVSFVLHTHNMSDVAIRIVNDLRQFADAEIIVVDDGSSHEHTRKLVDHLGGVNEFVLHANDLFDVIVFNRAFSFARGRYIVVIQDDDDYKSKTWVTRAIDLLDKDPDLAILGGRDRVTVFKNGDVKSEKGGAFQYAQTINAAPLWVRKDLFLKLGGFAIDFAPALWHEADICIRAWLSGYRVGWYSSTVGICALAASARRKNKSVLVKESTRKNFKLLLKRHGNKLRAVHEMVKRRNASR